MELKLKNCEIFLKDFINRKEIIELRKIILKWRDMSNFNWIVDFLDYEKLEEYKEKWKELIIEKIWLEDKEIFNKKEIFDFLYDTNKIDDEDYLKIENEINKIIWGKKKF